MTGVAEGVTKKLCFDVPNARHLDSIDVSYHGRGTQIADLVAVGLLVALVATLIVCITIYALRVRAMNNGTKGPLS